MKISQADKDFAAVATPVNYKKLTKTENGYRDERFEISLEYVKSDQGFKYVISGEVESRFCKSFKETQKMAILITGQMEVAEVTTVRECKVALSELEDDEDNECTACGCDIDHEDGVCEQCGKQHDY